MARLPVIVGFGGYNTAGRGSFHQSYRRTVIDSISSQKRQETLAGLASMMRLVDIKNDGYFSHEGEPLSLSDIESRYGQTIREGTLIRRIGKQYFDIEAIPNYLPVSLSDCEDQAVIFEISKKQLPEALPSNWQVETLNDKRVRVTVSGEGQIQVGTSYRSSVVSAGQLPDGFEPSELYASRFHPRGLQMAILGASDALNSMGIEWQSLLKYVKPDEIGVFSGSVMTQLDQNGFGGLLQSRLKGKRVSTKQTALGMPSMPADFINAYVLGSVGATGSVSGACATFLYNLKAGIDAIRSGRCRVVMVSSSEAPIVPEIIDGYATMGALATEDKLCKLDDVAKIDYRRSSRPFGENCGFTIAESSQHVILMDDALALEVGAIIHGCVPEVFINADGYKKSISAPGPGNYLTFAKAVGAMRNLLGDEILQKKSMIQAHGSSTPQNRVTESEIFDRVAKTFGINQWPVAAVKAYLGHSLGPASGDQLLNTLGIFSDGIIPGIKTIDAVANDVLQERLRISINDIECDVIPDVAFLNSKGFGGNNATACVLSASQTKRMLKTRYGEKALREYDKRNCILQDHADRYNESALKGNFKIHYHFGQNLIDDNDVSIDLSTISLSSYISSIDLPNENDYKDMIE